MGKVDEELTQLSIPINGSDSVLDPNPIFLDIGLVKLGAFLFAIRIKTITYSSIFDLLSKLKSKLE